MLSYSAIGITNKTIIFKFRTIKKCQRSYAGYQRIHHRSKCVILQALETALVFIYFGENLLARQHWRVKNCAYLCYILNYIMEIVISNVEQQHCGGGSVQWVSLFEGSWNESVRKRCMIWSWNVEVGVPEDEIKFITNENKFKQFSELPYWLLHIYVATGYPQSADSCWWWEPDLQQPLL
jgi:hypothetical protein